MMHATLSLRCNSCGTLKHGDMCPRCATPAETDAHFRAILAGARGIPRQTLCERVGDWIDRLTLWLGRRA